jgi:uncharacterized alkaline shock family protein YloU
VLDRPAASGFDLVLAGHMHDGQFCVPYPGGKLRLAHLRARYARGLYRRGETVMHVSPGLGTTFVPFRFCARPEATELVLRPAPAALPRQNGQGQSLGTVTVTHSYNRGMDGCAQIAPDVLARYAADAAGEVEGVAGLVGDRVRRHDGVRITGSAGDVRVEVHVRVVPGATLPEVGRAVQEGVAAYLERMAGSTPAAVDVVIREIGT